MACHIVAYTYEADTHCPGCTKASFGDDGMGHSYGVDAEGNEIHPIFGWDPGWHDDTVECEALVCGTCNGVIDVAHGENCVGRACRVGS